QGAEFEQENHLSTLVL
ncbi:hypothetical protein VCHENC02_5728B, partial [Vibrio harveyi]